MITVCQCNIQDGGRWSGASRTTADYTTALRFARFVASVNGAGTRCPPIGIIGMQELVRDADERAILERLQTFTGASWASERVSQGVSDGSGIGMFWRPDLVETHPDWGLGEREIDRLDSGYIIKFVGRLFKDACSDMLLAFFTGKLAWRKAVLHGRRITKDDRRLEAVRMIEWVRESVEALMQSTGLDKRSAVIATDLNCPIGSPAWKELNGAYSDPSRLNTFNSCAGSLLLDMFGKRFDYIWLERNGAGRPDFVDGPRRSPHFGSDHRAVYATIGGVSLT